MKIFEKYWFKHLLIQIIVLGIIGIWAIMGKDVEIYQSSDPNAIKNITLSAGTYRSYITYMSDCEDNAATYISESDNQLFLADTLQLYPWESVDYIQLWALEDIRDVSFAFKRSEGMLNITHVSIAKTTEWKRIVWTFVLFGLLILDGILLWKRKVTQLYGSNRRERKYALCRLIFLVIIGVISCKALYINRFIQGHDLVFHLSRIEGLKESLLAGQVPVRMQHTWFEGGGYAVSVMYGDILLYIPAFLRIMGYTLQTSYKLYIIFVTIGTIAITYFSLNKISINGKTMNPWVAMVATGIYTLSLYRLANVHLRAAVGEYTAMMFFPLVFCGFYRIFYSEDKDKDKLWVMPAIGMAGILTCHIISAVMVTITLLIWCILEFSKILKKERFFTLCKTVAGTIVLSAAFLIPFLDYTLMGNMKISNDLVNKVSYIQEKGIKIEEFLNFVPGGRISKVYGLTCTIIGVVLLVLCFLYWNKRSSTHKAVVGKLFCIYISTSFLATNIFPWDSLSENIALASAIAGTVQFPSRFAAIAMMLLIFIFALTINELSDKKVLVFTTCVISLLLSVFSGIYYQTNIRNENNIYKIYDAAGLGLDIANDNYSTFLAGKGEYIPFDVTDIKEYRFKQPRAGNDVVWQNMEREGITLSIIALNSGKNAEHLAVPILYYKGYRAKDVLSGQIMELYSGHNGMATVLLPIGYEGQIEIQFVPLWYWRVAEIITVIAWIYIILVLKKQR